MNTKVFAAIDNYCVAGKELKKQCREYLTEVAKAWQGEEFPLSEISRNYDVVEADVCIVYDGGNHPEYASNACSLVYGFGLDKQGNLYVRTEDCVDYEFDRVDWSDMANLCEGVDKALAAITADLLGTIGFSSFDNREDGVMTISKSDYDYLTCIKDNEDMKEFFRDKETEDWEEFCEWVSPKALIPYLISKAEIEGDVVRWEWR